MRRSLHSRLPFLFLLLALRASPQNPDYDGIVSEYVERFKYIAILEMKEYGIPASITLAQGILESNAGRSDLAVKANNHFGIKCHKEWTGPVFHQDDDKPDECFRKYQDPLDSYRDHSLFLTTRDRYKGLFSLKPDDYKGWAQGLKAAGYATNPSYPDLLIKTIERFSLNQYDRGAASIPPMQPVPVPAVNPAYKNLEYSYFAPGPGDRKTYTNNHSWFVFAASGETLQDLAEEFQIPVRKLVRYNDLETGQPIHEGDPVYLSKKQGKGAVNGHKVENGQSMWEISQIYAVKLQRLYQRNGMEPGRQPVAGELLILR